MKTRNLEDITGFNDNASTLDDEIKPKSVKLPQLDL